MRIDGDIAGAGLDRLPSLAGSRLRAYGSDKPGIDSGVAVEDIFSRLGLFTIYLRISGQSDRGGVESSVLESSPYWLIPRRA
jgi:hypothetical protein